MRLRRGAKVKFGQVYRAADGEVTMAIVHQPEDDGDEDTWGGIVLSSATGREYQGAVVALTDDNGYYYEDYWEKVE